MPMPNLMFPEQLFNLFIGQTPIVFALGISIPFHGFIKINKKMSFFHLDIWFLYAIFKSMSSIAFGPPNKLMLAGKS